MSDSRLARGLSRRVVLKAAGGTLLLTGCGEDGAAALVDGVEPIEDPTEPPYPLDTEGDDEMPHAQEAQLCDPLFLYSRAIVSPGAGSGPNVAGLVNPHGLPMELLAARFRVFANNTVDTEFDTITGLSVGVKLDMGELPIVDADVPINAFGTARDDDDGNPNWALFTDLPTAGVNTFPSAYTWRLKYPLLVPAGCVLTPVFSHLGQNHFPVTVDSLYICRSLPLNYTIPAKVRVPWVGSYNSISFDNAASQAAGSDASSELDLVNPFAQPLELSRLVGVCAISAVQGGSTVGINYEMASEMRYKLGKERIRSRSGDEVARVPTPFNGHFQYGWRAWDIPGGWQMRPGEFYKLLLGVDATPATAPANAQLGPVQFSVAAIGYRELPQAVFLSAAKGGA